MRIRSGEGWGQLPRRISLALAGSKFNVYESRIVRVIVHKTIAFNKLEDRIPQSQFVEITGIDQRHLNRTINGLLKKGVIFKEGNVYGIQRDFSKWETTPLQVCLGETTPLQVKNTPLQVKNTPLQVDSRDLSKRAYQEKGLSASKEKIQREKFMKGLKGFRKSIKQMPGKKKWDN